MANVRSAVIHAIFECTVCGEQWENYLTAQQQASAHATAHRHRVVGEVATSVEYNGMT